MIDKKGPEKPKMNFKKTIETHLRGWIPENFEISKRSTVKSQKSSSVQFGVLLIILAFAGSSVGAVDRIFGLGLFSGFGMHIAVILLTVCVAIAAITAFSRYQRRRVSK